MKSGRTKAETPIRLTRQRKRWLAVLLSGASNIGNSTPWRIAGGNAGDVYVMLAQMERLGWVTTRREPDPGDRPPRTFYSLTAPGRAAVMGLLHLDESNSEGSGSDG